jgi:glucosamine-6-phosphate deaminase
MRAYDYSSAVEPAALTRSGRQLMYSPSEKISVIEAESFPLLGRITALRFIEWVLKNPGGVIALPTGKTPEHFILWVKRILERWQTAEIRKLLAEHGITASSRPDMKSLTFVQVDEFYPMDARHENSFNYYVREYYIKGFGLSRDKALLIDATALGLPPGMKMAEVFPDNIVDLSLRVRQTRSDLENLQKEVINRVDVFCLDYESKIREMGGIGFFLGGIGPDGHVAFNVRGSSFYSVTRLTGTNYETQAAAASDLGGIEISRNRLVITIGLATITYNPSATVIIMASGHAKSPVVRSAIEEERHQQYPASVLQSSACARFYLTKGAASALRARRLEDFSHLAEIADDVIDDVLIALSLRLRKPLRELTQEDLRSDPRGALLLRRNHQKHPDLLRGVHDRIVAKLSRGLGQISHTTFLHTEPHQDDVMLSYLSYIYHLVRDPTNAHHFANLTSGFTSVANAYCLGIVRKLDTFLSRPEFLDLFGEGYFTDESKAMEDVYLYLDGTAAGSSEKMDEAEARRLLRNVMQVYDLARLNGIKARVKKLAEYLEAQHPGAKDAPDVQVMKGTLREWEVELLWACFGIESSSVHPLRLGFYQGDIFAQEPEVRRDVLPIHDLIRKLSPDVITVAFDPEGSGPDTHYKVLQAIAEAVRMYESDEPERPLRIWGYRNVWYRFTPAEATVMVPVSLNTLSLLETAFMNYFGSQRSASFPSYEYDGPFSGLARRIQVDQYQMMKTCLGDEFFLRHPHPRLRAARGLIFLKEMDLPEFYEKVRTLKKLTEVGR